MTIFELISELRKSNIQPRLEGENLKLIGEVNSISSELLATVKEMKSELIDFIKNKETPTVEKVIPLVEKQDYYPLSNAQKRIWVLSQFEGGNQAYNIAKQFYLKGTVVVEHLEEAFRRSIQKHESLRTTFELINDEPVQVINDEMAFSLEVRDFSRAENLKQKLEKEVLESFNMNFDFVTGPLLNISLIKINEGEMAMIFVMHHIISDGWSMGVLVQEVMDTYKKICLGQDFTSEELTIQYKDFSGWLTNRLQGESGSKSKEYWKKKDLGGVDPINLPYDFTRPEVNLFEGGTRIFPFEKKFYRRIEDVARNHQTTVFNIYRSALSICLHNWSGAKDIIVGSPVAGRSHHALKNQIGLYVNTLPLLSTFDANQTYSEYLKDISDDSINSLGYQDYPLDLIIEEENLNRDSSRNPLFDVMMIVQNTAIGDGSIDLKHQHGFTMQELDDYLYGVTKHRTHVSSKFDLTFNFGADQEGQSILEIEYRTKLFKGETIELLFSSFHYVLEQIIANSNLTLKSIQTVTKNEAKQLLVDFNQTRTENLGVETILDLIEGIVQESPEKVALIVGEKSFSFGELDEVSTRLAAYLQSTESIGEDELIGLKLDRDEWLVISILAILKAGGAYVPIDANYPEDRIRFIEDQCEMKICITDEFIKAFEISTSEYSYKKPAITRHNLAYVIFTSGSTGVPKGVMIKHENLCSFTENFEEVFGLKNVTTFAATTNFTFDISVIELIGVLSKGITIDLFSSELLRDPELIAERIKSSQIDGLQVTPSRCSQLMMVSDDFSNDLKVILVGGEAVSSELYVNLKKLSPQIVQVYGPTETCIWSTSMDVKKSKRLHIGKPLLNESIYILNDNLNLVSKGVIGEICIGGKGVAKGYVKREELTAEKFVKNPYVEGEMLYRTGDLGRWLPDGNVEFLGRKDDQVKIRGFRIELQEISNVLLEKEEILEAVVIAKELGGSEKELIAYFISNESLDFKLLSEHLLTKVPSYMVPGYFVQLDEMPLNRSGKIDRKELPLPEGNRVSQTEIVKPKTETEEALFAIWSVVLGTTDFGVTHNFFELGGHSLKATKLKTTVSKELSKEITMNEIFQSPTIQQQALLIDGKSKKKTEVIKRLEEDLTGMYPLSIAQERLWVLTRFEEASKAYHMPAAFRVSGKLEEGLFEKAILTVIERHESLRTVFVESSTGTYQKIVSPEEIDFNLELTRVNTDESIEQFLMNDWGTPFDLQHGPLVRCSLINFGEDQIVSFNMHHIISDGWSVGVLFNDVMQAYNGFINGASVVFGSKLDIQYKDFTIWQRGHLSDKVLNEQLAYWKDEVFKDGVTPINLPFTKNRPEVKTYNGAIVKHSFSEETTEQLNTLSKDKGASLFMTLMANVSVLLNKLSGQSNITIGTPVSGRDSAQLQHQIGFYVNTLPINHLVDANLSFSEFLAHERSTILAAFDYQNFPFELLVEALQPARDMSRSPLFDVMVTYQDFDVLSSNPSNMDENLEFERIEVWNAHTKYDLTFAFSQDNDQLILELEYNSDLFNQDAVYQYVNFFQKLINLTISDPEILLKDISLVSDSEKFKQLEILNDPIDENLERGVLELLAPCFKEHSEKIALRFKDRSVTYKELDTMSDAFAHKFVQEGIERIGLFMNRNEEVLAAVLGALKSGTTYVPIDVNYPEDRVNYIIEDANINYVLTNNREGLPESCKATIIESGELEEVLFRTEPLSGDRTAYLIYTSGSTGKPKGVEITHRNVIAFLKWANEEFKNTPFDTLYAVTSYCFDLSMFEMLLPLIQGKEIRYLNSALDIQEYLPNDNNVLINTVPSVVRNLMDQGISWENVVALNMAGEPVPKMFKEELDYRKMEVRNLYGPSEDTTYSTFYRFSDDGLNYIPIGVPVGDTHAYILDKDGNLVPLGVEGEICLSGESVAKGYYGKPELTAEKFIPNPFIPNQRMYRTGDVGKWENDQLSYVGRMDDQVKIRGFRIELGEIQYQIESIGGIKQAVVVVKEVNNEKEIVAYYECTEPVTMDQIANKLGEALPGYMIPQFMMELEAIPLNSNGKVDKKQLPDPEGSQVNYCAPANETEEKLVAIWEEILRVQHIGTKDNFFRLGGHSLNATRVITRIQEEFGVQVDLKNLFVEPTIQHLAEYVSTLIWMGDQGENEISSEQEELIL